MRRLLLLLTLLLASTTFAAPNEGLRAPAADAPAEDSQRSPRRVYAGVYLTDVSGFDLREGRFKADLEAWVKWQGEETPPPLAFVNGEVESREEVLRESDGAWRSIRWRVQGTFRGTFPLHAFPFDSQTLKVQLSLPASEGELIPDLASSGMAEQFSITGWIYEPYFAAAVAPRVLASDLGSIASEGRPMTVSSVDFTVELHRPFFAYLLKFLLPLAVIVFMGVLSFLLPPDRIDVRASITVTALLSVVAFHFSQSSTLPDVSYLVVADKIFLTAYALVFFLLLATVVSFSFGDRWPRPVRWMDRGTAIATPIVSVLVVISLVSGATETALAPPEPPRAAELRPSPGGDELRVGVAALATLNTANIPSLLNRGLSVTNDRGERVPHLVDRLPSMTNSAVRFLPDGGMTVEWRLKPNLAWSDGAPLTADDLAFSLELSTDPHRRTITRIDDRTIRIEYDQRRPAALAGFSIFPKHASVALALDGGRAALTERIRTDPLPGSGPYRLVSFDPKEGALLERNPHFAGPPPRLARIRFVITGAGKGGDAYKAGKVDLLGNLGVESLAQIASLPDTVASVELGDTLLFLQPDLTRAPLDDVRVRRALLQAIDREQIGRIFYGDRTRVSSSYRPPEAEDVAELPAPLPHDPLEAKRLLEAAGVKLPLTLPLLHADAPAGSSYARVVEVLTKRFALAGVTLASRKLSSKQTLEAFNAGGHGGLLLYSRENGSVPSRFFNLPYDPSVLEYDTRRPRPHFDRALVETYDRFVTTMFVERKHVLSRRLQEAWARELPLLPIAFSVSQTAHVARLEGFSPGEADSPYWNVETWFLTDDDEVIAPPKVVEGGGGTP